MRFEAVRGRRPLVGLALILVAVWLAAGLHRIEPDGLATVLDSPLGLTIPRLVEPGWHLAPPGFLRLTSYPLDSATLEIRPGAPGVSLVTREGSAVEAGLVLRYHVDADRVLDVHRILGPRYEAQALGRWAREALAAAVGGARYADVSGARVEVLREQVGQALGERMRQSGFVLLGCEVTGVRLSGAAGMGAGVVAGAGPGGGAPGKGGPGGGARPGGRILLVGLDGADWNIIDPLLARGRMPRLDRLVRGGVRGRMRTIAPVLSPVVWTSIATGVVPGRHGILDFVATTDHPGERVPVTSTQRRVKAFWNMLSESGVRVGVVGWWATWPAEPVDGFVVTDRVAYQLPGSATLEERDRRGKVHPPDADALVVAAATAPEAIPAADLAPFMHLPADEAGLPVAQAKRIEDFKTVLASGRTYVAAALALWAREHTEVTAVYLEGTDTVAHLFMPYAPPPLEGVDPEGRQRFGRTVDAYYEQADELLGRLVDGIQPDTVIVVSDHGFRSGDNRPNTEARIGYGDAADWHRKYGIIVLDGPAFRHGVTIDEASVLDVTPTLLRLCDLPVGEDMDGRPIEAAFDPAWLAAHRERYVSSWETTTPKTPSAAGSLASGAPPPGGTGAPGADAARGGSTSADRGEGESAAPGGAEPSASGSPDTEGDEERLRRLRDLGYIAAGGETANAHNNRGTSLLDEGRYDEAMAEFQKAIAAKEDTGIAYLNLARARYRKRDYDGAIAALGEHARVRPRSKEAETLRATIAMDRGRPDEAEAHFRKALEYEPNFTDARNGLGLLLEQGGHYDAALAEFRRVVAIDPDHAEARNNIGIILKERGKMDEAAAAFKAAIAADPAFAGSYSNLALIEEQRGNLSEAERLFRESLRRDASDAKVRANLGGLLYLAGRYEDARQELERAVREDPSQPAAYNNLGAVLGRLGRPADEIAAYRHAVDLDQDAADLHYNLGLALLKGEESAAGETEIRRVLHIDPKYRSAYLSLGEHLIRSGRAGEAATLLREGMTALPQDADVASLMGEAELAAGSVDEAIKAFETALRLRPGDAAIDARLKAARGEGGDSKTGEGSPP
jgi:tetratricopeptide (TPR) repeat protein/arylsulfatase A-like enzyme